MTMASTRVLFPDPVAPTRKIVLCATEPVGLPTVNHLKGSTWLTFLLDSKMKIEGVVTVSKVIQTTIYRIDDLISTVGKSK